MRWLELRVPPLFLFAVLAAVALAAPAWLPRSSIPFPGQRAFAIVALIVGCVTIAAGFFEFLRAGTSVNPVDPGRATSIVSTGIYRITRNPMYLGLAVALFGVAAWRSSIVGYAMVPLFWAYITRFQIVPEERVLLQRFGAEYAAYLAKVRRWI